MAKKKNSRLRRWLSRLLNPSRWQFEWRYWRGQTPWDTNVTPPEVLEFIAHARPGRALDLGCGTGTNPITLARHNWQVTGIDFSPRAIRVAQRKAAAAGLAIDLRVADATDLHELVQPYDYVLDIGCLLGIEMAGRTRYAAELKRLLRPGGSYMLYGWYPRQRKGRRWGFEPHEVRILFEPELSLDRVEIGQGRESPAAWYWLTRR